MKTNLKNQSGFTLIELILVVAIIGMLTAALAPSFGNLLANTATVSHRGVAGSVNSALQVNYSNQLMVSATGGVATFAMANLDNVAAGTACSAANPCFAGTVANPLATPGIADGSWSKINPATYRYQGPGMVGFVEYDYTPGAAAGPGTFRCDTVTSTASC